MQGQCAHCPYVGMLETTVIVHVVVVVSLEVWPICHY